MAESAEHDMNIDRNEGEPQSVEEKLADLLAMYDFEENDELRQIAEQVSESLTDDEAGALVGQYTEALYRMPLDPTNLAAELPITVARIAFMMKCGFNNDAHEEAQSLILVASNIAELPYVEITPEIEANPEALAKANANNTSRRDANGILSAMEDILYN